MKEGKFKNKRFYQRDIIEKWCKAGKKTSIAALSRELGTSRQQTYRLIEKYELNTLLVDHLLTNRAKRNEAIVNEIAELYLKYCEEIISFRDDNHYVPNFTIFYDFVIKDNYAIGSRTVYNYLISKLIFSPDSRHKTKSKIKKLIKEKHKEKEEILEIIDIGNVSIKKVKPYKSKDVGVFGDIVEIDACQHQWFGSEKYHIYTAVDRKSGYVLESHMEKEETAKGYYILLRKLFTKYGKPRVIITDKRRNFWSGVDNETIMKKALKELDIELYSSSQPTHKPNVERAYRNMQDIYPILFYKWGIKTFEEAEKVLEDLRIKYNEYYKKQFEEENNFVPINSYDIKTTMTLQKEVKIRNGSYLIYNGQFLAPYTEKGERVLLLEGGKTIVHTALDKGELFIKDKGRILTLLTVSDEDIFECFSDEHNKLAKKEIELEKLLIKNRQREKQLKQKFEYLIEKELELDAKEKNLSLT